MLNRKDFEAASQYLGSGYKQHNPTAADGPEGLRGFIDILKARYPEQRGEIKRVIAEGNLVEHWDVIQDIPAEPANSNGMF